jgi:hypothetical protein
MKNVVLQKKFGRPRLPNSPTKWCEKCNVETTRYGWYCHVKTKPHLKNDPEQTLKPMEFAQLFEKCNIQVRPRPWDAHLNVQRHLENELGKSRKLCEKCNIETSYTFWWKHLRTKNHLKKILNKLSNQVL